MKSVENDIFNFFKANFVKVSLIYTAIILFIYAPLVMQSFAFFDDYYTLGKVLTKSGDLFSWDIYSGRPIYAFLRKIAHPYMTSIDNFAYLRLISILGTLCFCIFLHYFIIARVEFENQLFSFFLPLSLSVVPAILVYNSWAVCFPYPFSIVLSGVAYLCAFDRDRSTTILRLCIGTVVLICSFFIYQPIGMVFLFFVFLCNCIDSRKIKLSNLIFSAIMLIISMFVSLLAAKILPKLLYGHTFPRSELITDFSGKIYWFFNEPIINMLNNYKLIPNIYYEIFSFLLFLLGLYFLLRNKDGILKILLSLVIIVVIMIPSLAIKESWASYRSCLGMELVFITILVYAISCFFNRILNENIAGMIFAGMLTVLYIYTQDLINQQFIQVSQVGYRALNQEIMTKIPMDYKGKIRFDLSNMPWLLLSKKERYDEFGNNSIRVAWCLQGMAASIKRIKGFHYQTEGDMILQSGEVCKDNCIVIRIGDLMKRASIY